MAQEAMTQIEQNYKKLAQLVIINAYKDKAKHWIENTWNFDLFCGLAQVNNKEIKKKFLSLKDEEIEEETNTGLSKHQIASDLGVSYATLDYWHKKLDSLSEAIDYIKNNDHSNRNHSKCDKHYNTIINLRNKGIKWKDIAEIIDIEYITVYNYAKKKNIK